VILAIVPKLTWYTARASGILAWVIVTASIVWGLTLSSRLIRRRGVPAWLLDLHRYLGTLTIVFTAVHLIALHLDTYVHFTPADLFIPMHVKWSPGNVAWGIVATYLLVAIQITSWLMRRMPRRLWHAIHLLSFPLFVMATIHGLRSGADRENLFVQWGALTCVVLVIGLIIFRLLTIPERRRSKRPRKRAVPAGAHRDDPATAAQTPTPVR
jgi:DMSO/TMAO reductase YedYZ heme-binding membrane subunit